MTVIVTVPREGAPTPTAAPAKKGAKPAAGKADNGDELPNADRFKVSIKYAASIDLEAIAKFCRGERQSTQVESTMVSAGKTDFFVRVFRPLLFTESYFYFLTAYCYHGG